MNFLILAAGTRNKIVQYFRIAVGDDGSVIATDSSQLSSAIYDADKYYIVPPITDPDYVDTILYICEKEKVAGVLSLIDPELGLLARNEERFFQIGTQIIGSSFELCDLALDKFKMYQWLSQHNYACASSWMDREAFYEAVKSGSSSYPVFVKPAKGSASDRIGRAYDQETVELLLSHDNELMIQEFLDGLEIGADVYVDMISKEVVSIFTKKKIKMRAGETDKAVSFKDNQLFALIEKFMKDSGFVGPVDIDIFDINGKYYISEVNPRFGGGYPHAYECGCNHMKMICENLQGRANEKRIGMYDDGIYMMKYNEVKVLQRKRNYQLM